MSVQPYRPVLAHTAGLTRDQVNTILCSIPDKKCPNDNCGQCVVDSILNITTKPTPKQVNEFMKPGGYVAFVKYANKHLPSMNCFDTCHDNSN